MNDLDIDALFQDRKIRTCEDYKNLCMKLAAFHGLNMSLEKNKYDRTLSVTLRDADGNLVYFGWGGENPERAYSSFLTKYSLKQISFYGNAPFYIMASRKTVEQFSQAMIHAESLDELELKLDIFGI